jgi:hypothetical protein
MEGRREPMMETFGSVEKKSDRALAIRPATG